MKTAALVLLITLLLPGSAKAGYDYRYDARETGQLESAISAKLTRGSTNTLFGWTELVRTPVQIAAGPDHGKLFAFVFGLPAGVFRSAQRTLVGVYEVATCYAPQSPVMPLLEGDVS